MLPVLLAGLLVLQSAAPAFARPAQKQQREAEKQREAQRERREARKQQREAAEVVFVGVSHHGQERHGDHFAADRLRSLLIQVHWHTLVGAHTQRLELITPDGSVYQTMTANAVSASGTGVVETRLPITGTWITEYDIHGQWTVKVYLNDAVKPVTSAAFTLTK